MEIKANVDAVLIGRILAGIIIVFSFVYSVKAAVSYDGFWSFLLGFITPLAIAFLIIMVTEVLRELRRRGAQNGS
jgi:hypothetical protein